MIAHAWVIAVVVCMGAGGAAHGFEVQCGSAMAGVHPGAPTLPKLLLTLDTDPLVRSAQVCLLQGVVHA